MTRLKKMRLKKNIKQVDVADILGVAPATVSHAEKRGLTNIKQAKRYARIFRCNPLFLLEGLGRITHY